MNLLIICIFILNILLILQVIYYFKEFKSNSKKIKKLVLFIAFGFMLLPFNSNAKGLMIIANGTVAQQCTNCDELNVSSEAFITNYRAVLDPKSFTQNDTYYFSVLFETRTLGTSIDVTDCGLNINGAYVNPSSRNSYRITNAQHGNLWTIRFQTEMTYIASSSLSNVPVFIQCDTTPAAQTQYVIYTDTETNDNTATGISIANQTRDLIDNNNSNTNKIIQNISNFVSTVSSGFNSVVGGLSSGVNGIVSGISSAISSGISTISTGINNIINTIIGTSSICSTASYTNSAIGFDTGYLDTNGLLVNSSGSVTSPFIGISENTQFYNSGYWPNANTTQLFCLYDSNKTLNNCYQYRTYVTNDNVFSFSNFANSSYIRFTIWDHPNNRGTLHLKICQNGSQGIFDKIRSFFDSFISFVGNLFNNTLGNVWEDLTHINLPSETPVSDLILLPVNLLNKLHSSLTNESTRDVQRSGSGGGVHDCPTYSIPFDFSGGSNTLTFPCIQLQNYLGSNLWNAIDLILVGFMIYNIAMMVVGFFESWSSLNDTFDSLYTPNHGTYIPHHSGGDRGFFE